MIKRISLLIPLLALSKVLLYAQSGSISGSVKTSDGQSAEFVNVGIKGTSKGTITDKNGYYQLANLESGTYTVVASFIGFKKQEQTTEVKADEAVVVNFQLEENAKELQEVIISSNRVNKETNAVAKIPLKNMENPQVYNTVSAEVMKQQAITSYDDAMRNVPGISRTWESTGRSGDGGSYFALRGFEAQPGLLNGLPGVTSGNLDPANVQEIQVLKGPSGTLFGGSFYGYGGIINTITKKPYYSNGGEIVYNFGSFGLNRITGDFNAMLSKKEKIALRVNTAYHTENSFQDAGYKKSFFIAPTLAYEVNDRLSFQFVTEILQEERSVAPVFFNSNRLDPLPFKTVKELNLNRNLSFTSNDLPIKNPRYTMQGQMVYKLSDKWTSQTVFSRGAVKSSGYYSYIWDDVSGDNYFGQYFHKEQQSTVTTDIQQNFNGDFKILKMRNRVLIGLDYFNKSIVDNGSGWAWARNVTPQGDVNYVDPFTGDTLPQVDMSQASIDKLLAGTGVSNSNISNSSYSAYVSDVLNVTRGLMAMVSLRMDYFDSKGEKSTKEDDYNQLAFSPKFGLVYQPVVDKISLFGNYMNGFFNVDPRQVGNPDGSNLHMKSFKPEYANQLEYGVKTNLFAEKLFMTVSVYDITVSNRVTGDPTNFYNSLQGGKVRSQGFEFDINAKLFKGLNLIAGYSHNDIKVVSGDENDFYSQPGRAPGGQGPQDLVNFWATYKFTSGAIKNFGIGVGGNYAGEYKVIDNSQTGVFKLPAYTLLNSSIFYNSDRFRFTVNVNNLTNTEYYIGYWSVNPQKPINFVTSVAYKF